MTRKRAVQVAEGIFPVDGLEGATVVCRCEENKKANEILLTVSTDFLKGSESSFLHWGRTPRDGGEWSQPKDVLPKGSTAVGDDGKAAQAAFVGGKCILQFSRMPSDNEMQQAPAPDAIAFVLKEISSTGEKWWKQSGGSDFRFNIRQATSTENDGTDNNNEAAVAKAFVDPEENFGNWSQFQRFGLCSHYISMRPVPFNAMAWITTVLRLASARKLDWFRKYNYQPKDCCHVQEQLAIRFADAAQNGGNEQRVKALIRLCGSYIPRGSSSCGDSIRMTILNIMRNHGIREGHRPGIECKFLEQWHQKLHTNTAPDDIQICEAYLRFLSSGNRNDFWEYLYRVAHMSREQLSKLPAPITAEPLHLPQLSNDIGNFLKLLKSVHSGADLDFMAEVCKGQIDHGAECMVFEIINNRHAWWIPGKINDCRRLLEKDRWKRDVFFLDCALENWQVLQIGKININELLDDDALNVMSVVLEGMAISRHDPRVGAALNFYLKVKSMQIPSRWTEEWSKLMLAAVDRISLLCMHNVDSITSTIQSNVNKLADAVSSVNSKSIEKFGRSDVASFGEETSRSLPELQISQIVGKLNRVLREKALLGPWDVVSYGKASSGPVHGVGIKINSFEEYCREIHENPPGDSTQPKAILCCKKLTGWEDIPLGVAALLVPPGQHVDVLSHIAIRARTQNVFLACCADEALWKDVESRFNQKRPSLSVMIDARGFVHVEVSDDKSVKIQNGVAPAQLHRTTDSRGTPTDGTSTKSSTPEEGVESHKKMDNVPPPVKLVMCASELSNESKDVGGKSRNLVSLQRNLQKSSANFSCPKSVCIPFGVFEKELGLASNKELYKCLKKQLASVSAKNMSSALRSVRTVIADDMEISEELVEKLSERLSDTQLDSVSDLDSLSDAILKVWASKWTDRAVSSRRANNVQDASLFMAVLIQNLVDADYSFVIHTKSPIPCKEADHSSSSTSVCLIEIVRGLGEPLVSNAPGKALSAIVYQDTAGTKHVSVLNYPSKDYFLFAPEGGTLICRSDSNGEDLPNFAGAGLYDSFCVKGCKQEAADYSGEKLIFDSHFRESMLQRLYDVGNLIVCHASNGVHQDIEGCLKGDSVYVVQTRSQMM